MPNVLIRGNDRHTEKADSKAEWGDASTSQGDQALLAATKETGLEQLLPQPPEGTDPAHTLILDFLPPDLQENKFRF